MFFFGAIKGTIPTGAPHTLSLQICHKCEEYGEWNQREVMAGESM